MQESLLTILGNIPILYSHLATVARRIGSRHHRTHPTAIFPCQDGYVGIAAQTPQQWEALCLLIDQPELLVDARFITGVQRAEHADELDAALLPWFLARTRQEVMLACQAQRIPVGLSCTIPELLEDPQNAASTNFSGISTIPARARHATPEQRFSCPLGQGPAAVPPLLGEHNLKSMPAGLASAHTSRLVCERRGSCNDPATRCHPRRRACARPHPRLGRAVRHSIAGRLWRRGNQDRDL